MKSNEELLREIFARLDALDYVRPEQIPDIPLYMDQLTTFMDTHANYAFPSGDSFLAGHP